MFLYRPLTSSPFLFEALWENVGFLCAILAFFVTAAYILLRIIGHPRFR